MLNSQHIPDSPTCKSENRLRGLSFISFAQVQKLLIKKWLQKVLQRSTKHPSLKTVIKRFVTVMEGFMPKDGYTENWQTVYTSNQNRSRQWQRNCESCDLNVDFASEFAKDVGGVSAEDLRKFLAINRPNKLFRMQILFTIITRTWFKFKTAD